MITISIHDPLIKHTDNMVEVFTTNVRDVSVAEKLVELLHNYRPNYRANFDLQDCDHILRVESQDVVIECTMIIRLLNDNGYQAAVLAD